MLNRIYEVGLAEITHRENVGLLAYSPLGFGMLTGKYAEGTPADSRLGLYGDWFTRYSNKPSIDAVRKYINLAREFSITPTQLALAFVNSRPFLTSNIIGATKMSQLEENIDSIEVSLNTETLQSGYDWTLSIAKIVLKMTLLKIVIIENHCKPSYRFVRSVIGKSRVRQQTRE